jgi:hypothetical protein
LEELKMVNVNVVNGELSQDEINAYIAHGKELYPEKTIESMDIKLDGEYVDVDYHFADVPFQRIRRITGYLVGTLDRFNNAKRCEVEDRVKHSLAH